MWTGLKRSIHSAIQSPSIIMYVSMNHFQTKNDRWTDALVSGAFNENANNIVTSGTAVLRF
jgi:hypothetical protein